MGTLTDIQIKKARSFYQEHTSHIKGLIENTERAYPPTDREDKNNPALWKASHWKWFFSNLY